MVTCSGFTIMALEEVMSLVVIASPITGATNIYILREGNVCDLSMYMST